MTTATQSHSPSALATARTVSGSIPAFSLTIFWGAFLLFGVQPLMAKFILPWFGGSAAVWTTCMLFFQVLLLGGYAYAHLSVSRLTPRQQVLLHLALLAVALLFMPIQPSESWKPTDSSLPTWRILLVLVATLGLPYIVLSATGPLMQAWFSQAHPGRSPYRLYALSNVGSLLALIAYPVVVESNLSRNAQAVSWSIGLAIFAGLAAWCGWIVWKRAANYSASTTTAAVAPAAEARGEGRVPRWLWFALPACASVLLLAVTNKICQDIAVIPFLWILPLVVYLLSFIISFDSPRWYRRAIWMPLLVIALCGVLWVMLSESMAQPVQPWLEWLAWTMQKGDDLAMSYEIALYVVALFIFCMVCHGEVYRLRPAAQRLSGYYLMLAAGGAFGGLFVAVIAPLIFPNYFELHVGVLAVGMLVAAALFSDPASRLYKARPLWAPVMIALALVLVGAGVYKDAEAKGAEATAMARSFFGVLKVYESDQNNPAQHRVMLQHGGTTHGMQFVSPEKYLKPTTYYVPTSGVGIALEHFPRQSSRRVGIVGLGAGTLASYGKSGDLFRFYEIDDNVARIARSHFTFLNNSEADVEVVLGDARLSIEREMDEPLDILVLDAFSSDAVPVHLLTREAFEIYLRRLKPDGVIAVHISNRYLALEPIVLRVAEHVGLRALVISDQPPESTEEDEDDENSAAFASDWILLANNEEFLELPAVSGAASAPGDFPSTIKMWTDDESNLLRILDYPR